MATTKNGIYYPSDYSSKADVPSDFKKQAESIDVKIDDLKEKDSTNEADIQELKGRVQTSETNISALQTDNTKNKKDISDIKDKDTEQDTELEAIKAENERLRNDLNNTAITEEAEGEDITLSDTSDARFKKFEITGNSKQETSTQSANVLDLMKTTIAGSDGLESREIQQNEILLTSTEIARTTYLRFRINLKAGTWYLSRKYEILSGTEGSITGQCLVQKVSDWSTIATLRKTQNKVSFTLAEDTEIYIAFSLKSSSTAIAEEGVISARFYEIMLSNEDIDYVPFTPNMPSIEYPSEIKTIKDNINFVICNKNSLDIQKNAHIEANGLTIDTDKNGELTINGTSTSNIYLKLYENDLTTTNASKWAKRRMKKGNYKFSSEVSGALSGSNVNAFIRTSITGGETISSINRILNKDKMSSDCILDKDTETVIYLWIASAVTFSNAKLKIQLEKGEEATEYIAHEEQALTVPVQQEMLEGDYFDLENEKEVHNWKKVIFNGTEAGWKQETTTNAGYRYYNSVSSAKAISDNASINIKCNKLVSTAASQSWQGTEGISASGNVNIYLKEYSENKTLQDFLNHLSENNITVYYKLAQPIKLDITAQQKAVLDEIEKTIHSYKGETNIYSTDEISPVFKVEAVKDTNKVISNISTAIVALGGV